MGINVSLKKILYLFTLSLEVGLGFALTNLVLEIFEPLPGILYVSLPPFFPS